MIQIEDWVVIASILAFFILCISYLMYFIITRKLFPKVMEFQKEISPNKEITILTIEGSGIIKKIEMQVTENGNSLIRLIVDQTSYTTFDIIKEPNNLGKANFNEQKDRLLKLEVNLDNKFSKDFALSINNRSDGLLNSSGKIFYEIKRPLKITLKSIYEGIKS